jgi:ABC-type sulfate/molybdate transport systems ATPase subunit
LTTRLHSPEEQRKRGRSTLLVTHAVEWALRLCDTVAVRSGGRLVYDGAPADLPTARNLPPGWSAALSQGSLSVGLSVGTSQLLALVIVLIACREFRSLDY